MQKHRKLAAIMFTDIVGYTAIMAKSEHKALGILHRHRDILKPLISEFNGEWLKEMGDGTLSSFASVVDAVNCAIEIQNSLMDETEFKLRIGIHIGDVVVEEGDVFGDGVNVASRIENLAEPGGICISGRVYEDIRNKPDIKAVFLGEKRLKNVEQPVQVYALKIDKLHESEIKPFTVVQPSPTKSEPSIAVLPFINMSADPEQEYFCDGMTEEIINKLTQIEDLRVIARTSSFCFKGEKVDIADIGNKLIIEWILEGSVRKAGNRIRVTAQLVKVSDQTHIFSNNYDRNLEDIFAIQDEISLAIVDALKVKLLKQEKAAVVKRHTEDHVAYKLYLLGRHHWNNRTEEQMLKGLDYFYKAVEKDPNYALAYTGIAESYNMLAHHGFLYPNEAYPKAKDAVKKALEIDDMLSETHAALGYIRLYYDWDWVETEREYRQAINLNPNNAFAHHYFAIYLFAMGRLNKAIAESKRAQELDPLAPIITGILGMIYCDMHQYNEAMEQFRKVSEITPNFPTYYYFGYLYLKKGNYKEAIEVFQKDVFFWSHGGLGFAYGMSGERDKAKQLIRELIEQKKGKYVPSYFIAEIYSGLGENDKAFEWLEQAYEERDSQLVYMKVFPEWDPLRSDPRFKALLKKAGLE